MVEIKNGGSPPAQLWCGVREESEMNGSMDGEGGGVRQKSKLRKINLEGGTRGTERRLRRTEATRA